MIPAALLMGVFFWALISIVKYWYYSKMKINYTHKLDDKVLDEIHRPSKENMEQIRKSKRNRHRNVKFIDEPGGLYPLEEENETEELDEDPNLMTSKGGATRPKKRPLTLFEDMDLRMKASKSKRTSSKYDRSMFDDPLTRLHRDLQEMKKKASSEKETSLPHI